MTDIAAVFPATLELATLGILIGVMLGVPLGVFAAVSAGSDSSTRSSRVVGLIGYSVPIFWLGLMGLLLFYAKLDWVAGPGRLDIAYDGHRDAGHRHAAVDTLIAGRDRTCSATRSRTSSCPPALLGYFSLAYISRMTRSFMLERARAGIHRRPRA